MEQLFSSKSSAIYEEQFKASTVGLVTAEDFKKKRMMVYANYFGPYLI